MPVIPATSASGPDSSAVDAAADGGSVATGTGALGEVTAFGFCVSPRPEPWSAGRDGGGGVASGAGASGASGAVDGVVSGCGSIGGGSVDGATDGRGATVVGV